MSNRITAKTRGAALRGSEAGRSSINSPHRQTLGNIIMSASLTEAFGDKENVGNEARASAATGSKLSGVIIHRSTRPAGSATTCRPCGPHTSKAGGQEATSLTAPARSFAGGWTTEKGERQRACKTPLAARTQGDRVSPPHLVGGGAAPEANSAAATTLAFRTCRVMPKRQMQPSVQASAHRGFAENKAPSVAGASLGGTSHSRAARKVTVRAARARGVFPAAHTPAVLCVPSRLMDSTAASRAGVYNPPSRDASVHPRFVPRRRLSSGANDCASGGVVGSMEGGRGPRYDMGPALETRRKAVVTRTTSSSGAESNGEIQERRRLTLAVSEDEGSKSPSSGDDTSVSTVSPVGCFKNGMVSDEGADHNMLLPPARCDEACSRELEAKARRRAGGGISFSGGSSWRRINGASEGCLNLSLDSTEGDDEVLMSPCGSSVGSISSTATYPSFIGDAVASSSLDSSWSMASVDANDREPNAREDRISGSDPVARMLLGQTDDYDYDGNGGDSCDASNGNSAVGGEESAWFWRQEKANDDQRPTVSSTPGCRSTPRTEVNSSFEVDITVPSGSAKGGNAGVAAPSPISGGAATFLWTGAAGGRLGFGGKRGGVSAFVGRQEFVGFAAKVEGVRDRRFRPIAFHRPS